MIHANLISIAVATIVSNNSHKEKRKSILVVDDDSQVLQTLNKCLGDAQFIVITAHDGIAALEILKKQAPDLIIADIQMPKMDGFQLCKIIRSQPNLESIPLVFLSVISDVSYRIHGLKCGADDYLTKPVNTEEVLAKVSTIFRFMERIRSSSGANNEVITGKNGNSANSNGMCDGNSASGKDRGVLEDLTAAPFDPEQCESNTLSDQKFLHGFEQFKQGKYFSALDIWEENIRLHPRHIQTRRYLEIVKSNIERLISEEFAELQVIPILAANHTELAANAVLSKDEYFILSLIDGIRSIDQICSASSLKKIKTLSILAKFKKKTIISIKKSV